MKNPTESSHFHTRERFDWRVVKSVFRREILLALLLLFGAMLMSIVSMLPAYHLHVKSNEFYLQQPINQTIYPPEEASGDLHVLESNLSLTPHDGDCLLRLYSVSKSNLTLIEELHLQNNTARIVDLQGETPVLFLSITFPSPSLSYKYTIWGYNYPYLLLALPAAFVGLAGAAVALIESFKLIAERTSPQTAKLKIKTSARTVHLWASGFQWRFCPDHWVCLQ